MLSYIFGGLVNHSKPSLVNHTSLFKICELKVFKNIKLLEKYPVIDQTIHWECMYTRLLNLVDNLC